MKPQSLQRIAFAAVLGCLLATASAFADDPDEFVAGIEDLPVMPGLMVMEDEGVVFDKPSGRIVEAYAFGAVEEGEVSAFYARTLPQLGWEAVAGQRFQREGEVLTLEFKKDDRGVLVTYRLAPNS